MARRRRAPVIGCAILLCVVGLLAIVGQAGPTLLFWSNLYAPEWIGVGRLPADTWKSLCKPGAAIYSDHSLGFHWTVVAADDGDFMIALGPEGLAIATAEGVTANWEGHMAARFVIPHWWLIAGAFGLIVCGAAFTYLLPRKKRLPTRASQAPSVDASGSKIATEQGTPMLPSRRTTHPRVG